MINLNVPSTQSLYQFQQEDIERMLTVFSCQKGIYNGNPMGAGKSAETLVWKNHRMLTMPLNTVVVILCPASATGVWEAEIDTWCRVPYSRQTVESGQYPTKGLFTHSDDIFISPGKDHYRTCARRIHFFICSHSLCWRPKVLNYLYEALRYWQGGELWIDEAHRLGNPTTNISRAALGNLYPLANRAMFISGSITSNSIAQLYPTWHTIAPELFPRYSKFLEDWCKVVQLPFGPKITAKNVDTMRKLGELARQEFLIQRTEEEVASQLPDIIEHKVHIAVPELDLDRQRQLIADFSDEIAENDSDSPSPEIRHARTELGRLAAPHKAKWIRELMGESGGPIVVFAYHRLVANALGEQIAEEGIDVVGLDGETPKDVRRETIAQFQAGKIPVLVCTYAMAEAVTLTAASTVVIAEMAYSRMSNEQAPKRVHRIGQKNKVHCYYLLVPESIDAVVYNSYRRKAAEHKHLLGEANVRSESPINP